MPPRPASLSRSGVGGWGWEILLSESNGGKESSQRQRASGLKKAAKASSVRGLAWEPMKQVNEGMPGRLGERTARAVAAVISVWRSL